jgi:hypothetical protein
MSSSDFEWTDCCLEIALKTRTRSAEHSFVGFAAYNSRALSRNSAISGAPACFEAPAPRMNTYRLTVSRTFRSRYPVGRTCDEPPKQECQEANSLLDSSYEISQPLQTERLIGNARY